MSRDQIAELSATESSDTEVEVTTVNFPSDTLRQANPKGNVFI